MKAQRVKKGLSLSWDIPLDMPLGLLFDVLPDAHIHASLFRGQQRESCLSGIVH
jgi:hypothetical protein